MVNKIIAAIAVFFTTLGVLLLSRLEGVCEGKRKQQLDDAERRLEDVQRANQIKTDIDGDPDSRDRVRERFTRD